MSDLKDSEEKILPALVLMLFGILLVFMISMVFLETKESFSEVYFKTPVPEKIFFGESFAVGFFVENHEKQPMQYTVEVLMQGKSRFSEKFGLNDGEKKFFEKSFSIMVFDSNSEKILVRVLKQNSPDPIEVNFTAKIEK